MIIFKPHEIFTILKALLPENPIIIEAGAFNGTDSINLAKTFPSGTIHSFEPVPNLFTILRNNILSYPNITCYQQALSDHDGSAPFYIAEKPYKPGKPSQASSLLKPKERLKWSDIQFPYTIHVPTITLTTWAQQQNIDTIDFLWLDTQGYELNILQHTGDILNHVQAIYTEVSFIESYENQPIYEHLKQWLEEYKFYEYGKTFTNTTDWFFGNALFVHKKSIYQLQSFS